MGEKVSVVATTVGFGIVEIGTWDLPPAGHPRYASVSTELGALVLQAMANPSYRTVQVMPSAEARRMRYPLGVQALVTADAVIEAVARVSGISVRHLRIGRERERHSVPRMLAMFLIRELLGYSYPAIGRLFERDHTTVVHGVSQINTWLRTGEFDVPHRLARVESELSGEQVSVNRPPVRERTL